MLSLAEFGLVLFHFAQFSLVLFCLVLLCFVCKMSEIKSISRKYLIEHIRKFHPDVSLSSEQYKNIVKRSVLKLFKIDSKRVTSSEKLDNFAEYFTNVFRRYWRDSSRKVDDCLLKHKSFFAISINRSDIEPVLEPLKPLIDENSNEPPSKKPFLDKSLSQKNRETLQIRKNSDHDSIIMSAVQVFRNRGQNDAAHILKRIHESPSLATELRKQLNSPEKSPKCSPLDALSLIVDKNLTTSAYQGVRKTAPDSFPSSFKVHKEKTKCRLPPETIQCSSIDIQAPMQAVCNLTSSRILELQNVDQQVQEFFDQSGNIDKYKQYKQKLQSKLYNVHNPSYHRLPG